ESLDLCDTARPSSRRPVTTVAPQALMLFNGDFVNEQAGHLADRLRREAGDDLGRQLARAYHLLLSRAPAGRELELLRADGARQERAGRTRVEARGQVGRVLLNLNEFVSRD